MDPGKIVSLRLSQEKIREAAEEFRKEHIFSNSLPVQIEHVIEATMGIGIIPLESLQRACDMEGFISNDFKTIYVDKDLYIDDRYYKRHPEIKNKNKHIKICKDNYKAFMEKFYPVTK